MASCGAQAEQAGAEPGFFDHLSRLPVGNFYRDVLFLKNRELLFSTPIFSEPNTRYCVPTARLEGGAQSERRCNRNQEQAAP